jgi:hypothetical protein
MYHLNDLIYLSFLVIVNNNLVARMGEYFVSLFSP